MHICHRDTLCDVIYHALLQDNSCCRREQCCGPHLEYPGDVYHPDYTYGKPVYFDVTVHSSLQCSLLSQSAMSAGVVASIEGNWRRTLVMRLRCTGLVLVEFLSLWLWRYLVLVPCKFEKFEMLEGDCCLYKIAGIIPRFCTISVCCVAALYES